MVRPSFHEKMTEAMRLIYPKWDEMSDEDQMAKRFNLDVESMALVDVGLLTYTSTANEEFMVLWKLLEDIDATIDLGELMSEEFADRVTAALFPDKSSLPRVGSFDEMDPMEAGLVLAALDEAMQDYDDIPDTPEQRQLIAEHNAKIARDYPNLIPVEEGGPDEPIHE